jgi:hypothetical protein
MNNLLRALALSTVLTLAALSASSAAPFGTCRTFCYGSSGLPTSVTWGATQAECCEGTSNPCPPGTTPRPISWNNLRCGV